MTTTTSKRVSPAKDAAKGTTTPTPVAKLTPAQRKSLDTLVSAVQAGVQAIAESDSLYATAKETTYNNRVLTARAIARLAEHPATLATRGPKAGTPALTIIATLTGFKPSTLEPLFKAAMELKAKGWHKRNTAPNADERAVAQSKYAAEVDRKQAPAGKGKGAAKGGKVTVTGVPAINGAIDAVDKLVTAYADGTRKFSADESAAIVKRLEGLAAMVRANVATA